MDWTLGCNAASLPLSHRNNFAHDKIRTGFSKPSLASSIFPSRSLSVQTQKAGAKRRFGIKCNLMAFVLWIMGNINLQLRN